VVPAKLIFLTAISLSGSYYPDIAYALTLAFEVATLCLVASSPSHLRYPWLAALLVAAVPTQPEVFAVSEYAFWWGALWSFVAIFWREGERSRIGWRAFLAFFGGMSSPMAIPAAVLLAARALVRRQKADVFVFVAGTAAAIVQVAVMISAPSPIGTGERHFAPMQLVIRFFGHYVISTPNAPTAVLFLVGAVIVAWLVAFALTHQKGRDPWFMMLIASLGAAIVASISRVPLEMIHPVGAARYFFFPYIFLAWLLLYTFAEAGRRGRAFVVCVLALGVSQFAMHGQQVYETFRWREELSRCIEMGPRDYLLPVQFNGNTAIAWHVSLSGNQCQQLLDRSVWK
jgi:hypothetical protein